MVLSRMDISRNRQPVCRTSANSCAIHSTLAFSTGTVALYLPSAASCACCEIRNPTITLLSRIMMTWIDNDHHRHHCHYLESQSLDPPMADCYRRHSCRHRRRRPAKPPQFVLVVTAKASAGNTATLLLLLLMLLAVPTVVRPYSLCSHNRNCFIHTSMYAFVPFVINKSYR